MIRRDLSFPLRLVGNQAAVAAYPAHVAQMVRMVLLTDPGERVCLPEFGAGLRRLLFAPIGPGIASSTEIAVRQALVRWLGDQIEVRAVGVQQIDDGTLQIDVTYELIDTREEQRVAVEIAR